MNYSRAVTVLASLAISIGLGYVGFTSYLGGKAWAAYQVTSQAGDVASALMWNMRAYMAFPLDPQYRRQLGGSLSMVMVKYGQNARVEPQAADLIARVVRTTGPDDTAALIPRAEYLINSGRWQEPEMADLMGRLRMVGTRMASYWLLEAYYSALRGDMPIARAAIKAGMAIRPVTVEPSRFLALKSQLDKVAAP